MMGRCGIGEGELNVDGLLCSESGHSAQDLARPRSVWMAYILETIEVLAYSAKIGRINAPIIHAVKGAYDH